MELFNILVTFHYFLYVKTQNMHKCTCPKNTVSGRMPVVGLVTCHGKRFNSHWTASDVSSVVNCTQWTAELVNKLSSTDAARGFTAQCLAQFNVSGIEKKFLEKISLSEVKNLETKTLGELIISPVETIPQEEEWVRAIVDKLDWEKSGDEFAQKATTSKALLEIIFDVYSEQPEKLKRFFTARTIKKFPNSVCSLFTKELIESCPEKLFKGIRGDCLSYIPEEAFKGFTLKKFKHITPKALESITRAQADELCDEIIVSMTAEMANHWGRFGDIPKIESGDKEEIKAQTELVVSYLQSHPCMSLKGVKKEKIKTPRAKKIINIRCSPIWKNKLSSSTMVGKALVVFSSLLLAMLVLL